MSAASPWADACSRRPSRPHAGPERLPWGRGGTRMDHRAHIPTGPAQAVWWTRHLRPRWLRRTLRRTRNEKALVQGAPSRQCLDSAVNRSVETVAESALMWERWVNEGGRPPPQAVADREHAAVTTSREARQGRRQGSLDGPFPRRRRRRSVIIAGGGVAALE